MDYQANTIIGYMARQLEQTIILKAAGSLRGELECAAKEAGVSLSALVRKILIEWCSERVAERGDVAGMGPAPVGFREDLSNGNFQKA